MTFRVIGGYRKAGTSFLKRVTGRIFTLSKQAENFIYVMFFTKKQPKVVNTFSAHAKSTVMFHGTSMKY
jgi:hypothetical protein